MDHCPDSLNSTMETSLLPDVSLAIAYVFKQSKSVPLLLLLVSATTTVLAIIRKFTKRATMDVPLVRPDGAYDFGSLLVKGYREVSHPAGDYRGFHYARTY